MQSLFPQILAKLITLLYTIFYILKTSNNFILDDGTDVNMLVFMQLAILINYSL